MRLIRSSALAALPALCALSVAVATPGMSEERLAPALQMDPSQSSKYLPGERLTFTGDIGTGRQDVVLQFHMGRPGDAWTTIDGSGHASDTAGRFRIAWPAPAMFGIRYRVRSQQTGTVTTPVTLKAMPQEIMADAPPRVDVGEGFAIQVDATPPVQGRDGISLQPPPVPGRVITLQRRDGRRWSTIDTTTADAHGHATFRHSETTPGTAVYRVRQEDWTADGDRIGWFPSFPVYVKVGDQVYRTGARAAYEDGSVPLAVTAPRTAYRAGVTTASKTYGWSGALWDFAWEYGESLTSPDFRGRGPRSGRWLDTATGTGRASLYNGGLILDSSTPRGDGKDVDRGTTTATMRGKDRAYGRWELRVMPKLFQATADPDYRMVVELVPADPAQNRCGQHTITVAEILPRTRKVRIAANAHTRRWTRTWTGIGLVDQFRGYAVEIGEDQHITWFRDGTKVATLRNRNAVSDLPMTLRLRLAGDGAGVELDRARMFVDWVRGWDMATGRSTYSGTGLTARPVAPC